MKVEITKTEEPLLWRTFVSGQVTYTGVTPSKDQLKDEIASKLSVDKDLVVIRSVYNKLGTTNADLTAYAYENKEALEKTEKKGKKQREAEAKAVEEAKKAAAEPKEEKKEETPAEEKKKEEESKAEEKKEETPAKEGKSE